MSCKNNNLYYLNSTQQFASTESIFRINDKGNVKMLGNYKQKIKKYFDTSQNFQQSNECGSNMDNNIGKNEIQLNSHITKIQDHYQNDLLIYSTASNFIRQLVKFSTTSLKILALLIKNDVLFNQELKNMLGFSNESTKKGRLMLGEILLTDYIDERVVSHHSLQYKKMQIRLDPYFKKQFLTFLTISNTSLENFSNALNYINQKNGLSALLYLTAKYLGRQRGYAFKTSLADFTGINYNFYRSLFKLEKINLIKIYKGKHVHDQTIIYTDLDCIPQSIDIELSQPKYLLSQKSNYISLSDLTSLDNIDQNKSWYLRDMPTNEFHSYLKPILIEWIRLHIELLEINGKKLTQRHSLSLINQVDYISKIMENNLEIPHRLIEAILKLFTHTRTKIIYDIETGLSLKGNITSIYKIKNILRSFRLDKKIRTENKFKTEVFYSDFGASLRISSTLGLLDLNSIICPLKLSNLIKYNDKDVDDFKMSFFQIFFFNQIKIPAIKR